MDVLESNIFRAVMVVTIIVCWWLIHRLHQQSFLILQWSRMHDSLVTLNRDKAAEVNADLARTVSESKHVIPYVFAIRQYGEAPDLVQTRDAGVRNTDVINERKHPREVNVDYEYRLRIETTNRGRMLEQDLQAELPRFKRQMKASREVHDHQRRLAAQGEIGRIRQAIVGAQSVLISNPALKSQLTEVISILQQYDDTMVRARDEGTIPDSDFGEMMDAWMTGVLHKHMETRFGVKAA